MKLSLTDLYIIYELTYIERQYCTTGTARARSMDSILAKIKEAIQQHPHRIEKDTITQP